MADPTQFSEEALTEAIRRFASKGGHARAKALTREQISEIGRRGALKRAENYRKRREQAALQQQQELKQPA